VKGRFRRLDWARLNWPLKNSAARRLRQRDSGLPFNVTVVVNGTGTDSLLPMPVSPAHAFGRIDGRDSVILLAS